MWHFPNRNNDILNIIVADLCVFPNWNYSLKCVFLQWKTCRCVRFQCRKIGSNRGGLYAANRGSVEYVAVDERGFVVGCVR